MEGYTKDREWGILENVRVVVPKETECTMRENYKILGDTKERVAGYPE
jgi:hypothetical protein